MPTTSMGKTMTSFWMDSRTPEDSRWHSKHEGDFHTEDRLADHFVGKLRDECRGETSELAIMVRFTRMLKELLDPYESQDNLLLKLADTGRVATLLHQYIDNALDMLSILDPVKREEWHTHLLEERQDRLKVFEEFVKDDAKVLAACGGKNQQLEIVTLLRYCVEKYHDGLTPFAGTDEKYRDKLLGEELDTIAMVYELVVRKANVVSGKLPEWFFTSEHEWAWVSKAKVEDSKNAWNKTAREKFLEGKAGSEVRGVMSEEVCVRLASIWTELNHPHLRKFYGASHVGIPFVIHETCYSPSYEKEKNVWHYASNYALGLQYIHDRRLVYHDVSPATFLCSYSERRGVMDGLGLVPRSEAGRSFQATESMESLMARDVQRFGISIFFLLAGVRNLSRPSESRDKNFDSWKYGSTKSLPEVRPQFITETEWGIVQSLSTSDPAKRSGLVDAAHKMKFLDREDEDSKNDVVHQSDLEEVDVNTYEYPGTQKTAANILDEINEFCDELDGPEHLSINWRVYTRLDNIHKQLQILRPLPTKRLLEKFCQLLNEFCSALNKKADKMDSCQASAKHTVAGMNFGYHHEIDNFIRGSPLLQYIDVCHQWQPFWEQDQQAQQTLFQSCLDNPATFLDKVERTRWAEAVSFVKFEAHNRPGAYSSDVVAKVNLALQEAVKRTKDVPDLRDAQIGEPLPKWFVMNYQIHLGKHIGGGGFGTVYEGKWFGTDVVVKLQKVGDEIKPEERAKFRQEAGLWFSLNHSNLIKLYGACYEGKQPFFVCERATRNTLQNYLKLKYHERWFRLLQAAQGLQHLHEHNIVHGDLKGDNILVCDGGATKLADFGLSILASTSEKKTLTTAAVQWKAPECLDDDDNNHPTFASDIFAFGMCIIEAVTGTYPWGMLEDKVVTRHLKNGEIPTRSDKFKPHEWKLVEQMCCFDSQKRIGIGAVIKILEDIGVKHLLDRAGMMGTAKTEGNMQV